MPEGQEKEEKIEKKKSQKPESGDEASWSEDQKNRRYYYDDAHGYEIYQPDDESEDD